MDLVKAFIAGQIRHLMTGAAAALATYGAIKGDQTGAFVDIGTAILLYLAGSAWSAIQKWRSPPPIPPAVARVLPLLVVLPLLGGCNLDSVIGLIDTAETVLQGVNQGIERADTAAKRLCPQLESLGASAKQLACAASASGTPSTRLAKIATYRKAFCDNPSAKGAAELVSFVAEGIRAARAATAAGCQAQ